MARMGRPGLTEGQKEELWERWKKGESLSDIGRAIGKHAGSVFGILSLGGGIYQPPRCRSERSLTIAEREEISRGIAAGHSMREIARRLNRATTIRGFQFIANHALFRQRQSLFSNGRPGDVATQTLQLVTRCVAMLR